MSSASTSSMFSVAVILLLAAGSCVNSIALIQPDSMVVQPGQSLTITCQVSGYSLTDNSYATGWIRQCDGKPMDWILHRWGGGDFYQNNALKNKFLYHTHTSTSSVTLTGQNMQPEDTAVYYCVRGLVATARWAFDYWGKGTMVTVSSATSTRPTVFPLVQCGSGTGDTITLGCLATGFTPSSATYSWSKNGSALTDFVQYPPVQKNDVYSAVSQIRVRRQDWDDRNIFKCAVTHAAGNAQATMQSQPSSCTLPTRLLAMVSSVDGQMKNDEVVFGCFAKDFSPKVHAFKWLKNDEDISEKLYEINTPVEEKETDNNNKVYSAASFLAVKHTEWAPGITFTCQFEGKSGGCKTFLNSSVTYNNPCPTPDGFCPDDYMEVKIIEPTLEDLFLTKKGKIVCQVMLKRPTLQKMSWEDEQGRDLVGSSPTPDKDASGAYTLSLDISYDEWTQGIKRYCVVEHSELIDPYKKPYERNVGGQPQRPSVFMLPAVEHTRKQTVTLTCFVKDFLPQDVYVSWLVDDEEADSSYDFHTTNPVANNGTYSAYGQLLLSLEQWEKNDVVYSCAVHHESVANTTKALVRSIGYRSFDKTNLVNLNMNVPEACKAQ